MPTARIVRTFGLLWLLCVAGLAAGCGPSTLSPTDQEKFEGGIKQERKGRHEELKTSKEAEKKQGAAGRARQRGR